MINPLMAASTLEISAAVDQRRTLRCACLSARTRSSSPMSAIDVDSGSAFLPFVHRRSISATTSRAYHGASSIRQVSSCRSINRQRPHLLMTCHRPPFLEVWLPRSGQISHTSPSQSVNDSPRYLLMDSLPRKADWLSSALFTFKCFDTGL